MTSYWFSDLCALFNSISINPFYGTDKNYQYNSLTRLIIVVSLAFAYNYPEDYVIILATGLFSVLLSVCVYFVTLNSSAAVESRTIQDLPTDFSKIEDKGGLTNHGKDLLKDYNTNTKNSFLINRPVKNTDNIKHRFMLDGDKSPKNITNEEIPPDVNNKFAKQIMTGTIKQLNTINKNISPV